VKRAVCYPSSIKRIYRTVIDMKLDHFTHCKYVPADLKDKLNELKTVQTRSTGTTMQYFIRSAHAIGMADAASGVVLDESKAKLADVSTPPRKVTTTEGEIADGPVAQVVTPSQAVPGPNESKTETPKSSPASAGSADSWDNGSAKRSDSMTSSDSFDSNATPEYTHLDQTYEGKITLAVPEDAAALSPLRCFLRKQVCAFSATEEDIAVRAPTTFSISVGQVGIGCMYCLNQPSKLRSNRAVCFPFSVGRIYQSVADIQRFHLGECKMLPPNVRERFESLQSASSKGSKGLATRQYWVASAKKLGLVDTQRGIRFGRDPSKPEQSKSFSLDILAQVAMSVTTTSKQLVVPDDRPYIADFLYCVMEQLQPW
jgi:hypothetical protein